MCPFFSSKFTHSCFAVKHLLWRLNIFKAWTWMRSDQPFCETGVTRLTLGSCLYLCTTFMNNSRAVSACVQSQPLGAGQPSAFRKKSCRKNAVCVKKVLDEYMYVVKRKLNLSLAEFFFKRSVTETQNRRSSLNPIAIVCKQHTWKLQCWCAGIYLVRRYM